MANTTDFMPDSHIASLAEIESGYWWFVGRIYWAESLLKDYIKTHPEFKPAQYCDLGCGTGGFANAFSTEFKFEKTLLVDGDPKVLNLTQRYPLFITKQMDFNTEFTLPFSPNIVSCMDVLEHIEKDGEYLKKAVTSMQKNSVFIASVPACPSFYSEWDRKLGHFRRYTPSSFRSLLENSGLKVETLTYMWSFLSPMGPIRRLRKKRYESNMEFEAVPSWINETLIGMSKMEYGLSKVIPLPIGTSLIAIAVKN